MHVIFEEIDSPEGSQNDFNSVFRDFLNDTNSREKKARCTWKGHWVSLVAKGNRTFDFQQE